MFHIQNEKGFGWVGFSCVEAPMHLYCFGFRSWRTWKLATTQDKSVGASVHSNLMFQIYCSHQKEIEDVPLVLCDLYPRRHTQPFGGSDKWISVISQDRLAFKLRLKAANPFPQLLLNSIQEKG